MSDLSENFPELFFDIKTVEEKTPKAQLPSMQQVLSAVLVNSGQNNPGLAANLARAAEDLVVLRATKTAAKGKS